MQHINIDVVPSKLTQSSVQAFSHALGRIIIGFGTDDQILFNFQGLLEIRVAIIEIGRIKKIDSGFQSRFNNRAAFFKCFVFLQRANGQASKAEP